MSTGYGRLAEARDKAQPIAPDETVEVLAIDLDETLRDYRRMALEIFELRGAISIALREMTTCKCDGTDAAISEIEAILAANAKVRGDAPLYGAASLSTDGLCSGGGNLPPPLEDVK